MKQILFFIAEEGFRDEEYFEPKQVLEDAGHICDAVSTNNEMAMGSQGATVMPTTSLDVVNIDDYNAIVLVGGPGARNMGEDFRVKSLVIDAFNKNKLIGAICIAPTILAKYGLIKERDATVFPSGIDELKSAGVNYKEENVIVDSNETPVLITADGPNSAIEFGEKIKKLL